MTNFEKYKDELMAMADADVKVALVNGVPRRCDGTNCCDCDFYNCSYCNAELLKWLYEEFCPFKRGERVILTIPGQPPLRCYFAEQKENGYVSVFSGGRDEWSSNGDTTTYPEKCIKPYKECEETE